MINSENIVFTNNATSKNAISKSILMTYEYKSVELRIIKDTISMYQNSFMEKEKVLKEEKQKLKELNYQMWSVEDSYCEQIWQFSHEHNFSDIFKCYPFVKKTDHCAKQRNNDKDDVEKSSELIDLINEIDTIRAEIFSLNREKNVKQEMESILMILKKLQLIADEITELLRLISPLESSCEFAAISIPIHDEVIFDSVNKIKRHMNDTGHGNSINKKTCSNQKEKLSFKCSEEYKNFTPKKRSEISIKFEQHRRHIIDNY
ncbi:uncharacterized protein LOC126857178 [Cataglyphis hispanica]|uniref:uncharacterized protein LOC126857178 n=1 Tax=Cataglyphis hispanica TaxID=1086592 RepID=UPI00217FEDF3|nr:uncharacterized protein LOC126857178 [Cataglyphis hispanica]